MASLQYRLGFKNGQKDNKEGCQARSSRLWQKDYRNGYSDGFNHGKKKL